MTVSHFVSLAIAGLLAIGGCAKREIVVLLPESDGSVGSLSVADAAREVNSVKLNQAFAAARLGGALGAGLRDGNLTPDEVDARFGEVTGILPEEPDSFILYFDTGQTTLSAENLALLDDVRQAIAARPAAEMEVVGHTDTVGDGALNDQLSIKRAEAATTVLVGQLGIDADKVTASGRGERQLAEPTPDDTANASNRRVELRVR